MSRVSRAGLEKVALSPGGVLELSEYGGDGSNCHGETSLL